MTEIFSIIKIKENNKERVDDIVVEEAPFTIMIGDKELAVLLCTPADLKDLAAGFLWTAGFVKNAGDIKSIIVDQKQCVARVVLFNPKMTESGSFFKKFSAFGRGKGALLDGADDIINRRKTVSDFKIKAADLSILMSDFQKKSELFLRTGGAHSAALADADSILIFKEDIGRLNAIDKVIGCGIGALSFENKILISSGRISSETLLKTQRTMVPLLVSQSAPTNQAVKLAKNMGVTLIGFARESRMNIYSHEERIL